MSVCLCIYTKIKRKISQEGNNRSQGSQNTGEGSSQNRKGIKRVVENILKETEIEGRLIRSAKKLQCGDEPRGESAIKKKNK